MFSERKDHKCLFALEQTQIGYLAGQYVCTRCGVELPQSQWLRMRGLAIATARTWVGTSAPGCVPIEQSYGEPGPVGWSFFGVFRRFHVL